MAVVHRAEQAYRDALAALPARPALRRRRADVRWMIEELRVSLFAQTLGTPAPVSENRILAAISRLSQRPAPGPGAGLFPRPPSPRVVPDLGLPKVLRSSLSTHEVHLRGESPRKGRNRDWKPPVRRRLLGGALRRYRENLGYALDDAARILECDRSKISRIETGQRGIRPKELRELLTEYGVPDREQAALLAIAQPRRPARLVAAVRGRPVRRRCWTT